MTPLSKVSCLIHAALLFVKNFIDIDIVFRCQVSKSFVFSYMLVCAFTDIVWVEVYLTRIRHCQEGVMK